MKRVDAVIVSLVVTEYDADGRPINEEQTKPLKMFATAMKDLPAEIDRMNAEMAKGDGEPVVR